MCARCQVGDPNSDHQCWERPEDIDTPRTAYKVDSSHPGSDVAAETAAAFAAASVAFRRVDYAYSTTFTQREEDFQLCRQVPWQIQ